MKTTRYVFCIMMAVMCSLGAWAQLGKRFPSERKVVVDPKTGVEPW